MAIGARQRRSTKGFARYSHETSRNTMREAREDFAVGSNVSKPPPSARANQPKQGSCTEGDGHVIQAYVNDNLVGKNLFHFSTGFRVGRVNTAEPTTTSQCDVNEGDARNGGYRHEGFRATR